MIRFLCKIIFVLLVALAAYYGVTLILRIPPKPKKLSSMSKTKGLQIDQLLFPLYKAIAKVVYMDKTAEKKQEQILKRAGITFVDNGISRTAKPKEIMARSILGILFGLAVAIWGLLVKSSMSTIFTVAGIMLGVAMFVGSSSQAANRNKEKDAEIKKELPRLIGTIITSLRSKTNLEDILTSYMTTAGPALKSELEILVADMNVDGGSQAQALNNFDSRIGQPEITELCSCLTSQNDGVDQTIALRYLEKNMRQSLSTQRQLELEKLPGKMRRSFVPVAVILILMFFYTVFMQVFKNFTLFF